MNRAIELIEAINASHKSEPWRERVNRKRLEMDLLGHNALVMDKLQKEIGIQHQGLKALQNATTKALGGTEQSGDPDESEDSMGVNIGDQIHYHIDDRDNIGPREQATQAPSLLSKVAPYVGTALLGAAGAYGASQLAKPAAVTPVLNTPAATDTDTDTKTEIGIYRAK